MQFNTSKCEVLHVSRACTQIPFTRVLNGAPLTETVMLDTLALTFQNI